MIAAHILVLTSPIWLGQKSSVCMKVIERLYANSGHRFSRRPSGYRSRRIAIGTTLPLYDERGREAPAFRSAQKGNSPSGRPTLRRRSQGAAADSLRLTDVSTSARRPRRTDPRGRRCARMGPLCSARTRAPRKKANRMNTAVGKRTTYSVGPADRGRDRAL